MHQETKIVKVGDLPAAEREARGLVDMPDTMEVPIVVAEIVKSKPTAPTKPLQLPPGHERKAIGATGEKPSDEISSTEE